ncbi:hypothetical protein [Anaeromyxobacter sp. Fw109-5]|uniref:hypothetical protein n=1 Tax=Anaeromyxobacter sp. (strain Fw109-5) TaxID=404589 RepID=UPI000158A849|nr:hypothetical protein [Anaeromyxobacter sp. Fw109-5]ABS28198.1 hypothetical protein Anae109_4020 [Anaeromyxobacter sp. Fw109-5]
MTPRKTTDRLLGEMRRAYDLVEQRRADEAVNVYREIVAEARKVGLDSAHLHWAFAVACDYSGESPPPRSGSRADSASRARPAAGRRDAPRTPTCGCARTWRRSRACTVRRCS